MADSNVCSNASNPIASLSCTTRSRFLTNVRLCLGSREMPRPRPRTDNAGYLLLPVFRFTSIVEEGSDGRESFRLAFQRHSIDIVNKPEALSPSFICNCHSSSGHAKARVPQPATDIISPFGMVCLLLFLQALTCQRQTTRPRSE